MHKTFIFRIGLLPVIFLIWAWIDSTRANTWATCETAGYRVDAYHYYSVLYFEYSSGASGGLPKSFSFSRDTAFDGYVVYNGYGKLLPRPSFRPELRYDPGQSLTEEEYWRVENGDTNGGIAIPHWLVLALYVVPWLWISFSCSRRRSKLRQAVLLPG